MDWRGFELHPETPVGGMPLARLVPPGRLESMRAFLRDFAARFGIDNMPQPEHVPNTRRVLAMAEYARDHARLDAFRDTAMTAYWLHRANLERDDELAAIASRSGLDPDAALRAADAPAYLQRVDALRAEAAAAGVTGIPTFFFGDERVAGCQPYEVLEAAAQRAGARRKRA